MMTVFEEYIRQSEPHKQKKGYARQTAIGLQVVDGLKTSDYLRKNELRNRYLHVLAESQSAAENASKCNICTLNCTLEELALLNFIKESPKCNAKRNSCTYRKIRTNGKDDHRKIICTRHS